MLFTKKHVFRLSYIKYGNKAWEGIGNVVSVLLTILKIEDSTGREQNSLAVL